MAKAKKVRIHNPITNTYYQVRQKTTKAGQKGSIIGKWSSKTSAPSTSGRKK